MTTSMDLVNKSFYIPKNKLFEFDNQKLFEYPKPKVIMQAGSFKFYKTNRKETKDLEGKIWTTIIFLLFFACLGALRFWTIISQREPGVGHL